MRSKGKKASAVLLVGFEGSVQHTLEYFFSTNRVGKKYRVVRSLPEADWVVFNADQPQSKELLKAFLEKKIQRPAIVVSIKELDWPASVTVVKPFTSQDLIDAITALEEGDFSSAMGTHPEPAALDVAGELAALKEEEGMESAPEPEPEVRSEPARQPAAFANEKVTPLQRAMEKRAQADKTSQSGSSSTGGGSSRQAGSSSRLTDAVGTQAAALLPILEKKRAQQVAATAMPIEQGFSDSELNMGTVFGRLPELDWSKPADKRRLTVSLDGMLLPWIQKAVEEGKKNNKAVAINGLHLKLEYLPWTDCFVTSLSEDVLYTVMTSRFGMGELSLAEGGITPDNLEGGLSQSDRALSSENLLWLAGLWTAQGRVLPFDDPAKPRRLKHVPDCVRRITLEEVHSVANLWQSRSLNAFDIISELGISQRYVFGVMAAAVAANVFEYQ